MPSRPCSHWLPPPSAGWPTPGLRRVGGDRKLGIDVLTSTRVESIDDSGPQVRVTVTGKDGAQRVLEADKVLQAIGFAPNVTGYGLENTGVRLTERGAIDVDGRCRTSTPSATSPRS